MVIRSPHRKRTSPLQIRRVVALLAGASVWAVIITARLVYLQVGVRDQLLARAEQQQRSVINIAAGRGNISDRRGEVLAASIDLGSIYAHPRRIDDHAAIARHLAPILGQTSDELAKTLSRDTNFVYLQRKASGQTLDAFRQLADELGLGNVVGVLPETKRYYPHRDLAAHVLGFVDIDNHGQAGLERSYDLIIRGDEGKLFVPRDGANELIGASGLDLRGPSRGHDLQLTLDRIIQYAAEEALQEAVHKRRARAGSALVLDVQTGAVLAMASHPRFNPNVRDRALSTNSTNLPITYRFEPGSAFKIVTAAAALQEGVVDEEELIDCQGGALRVGGHTYNDWRQGFGVMTFRRVIMLSSNVGTIKVCMQMPPDTYHRWLRDFGFGETTGVELPAESSGYVTPTSGWSKLSQSSMAIGQEISVTPLQLATAAAAVANGGLLLQPFVVSRVTDNSGKVLDRGQRRVRRRVLDREIASRLTSILEQVVEDGTGKPARIPGYRVAGKTATAQKIDPRTKRYSSYVATFVGYLPASEPRIAVLVSIDEPTRGYGHQGSQAAAPAFREIAESAIRVLRIPPDAVTKGDRREHRRDHESTLTAELAATPSP